MSYKISKIIISLHYKTTLAYNEEKVNYKMQEILTEITSIFF